MRKGFTLVELSIVLVIIGLLIGGILVGQSLIASARVNKVISEVSQYQIAVRGFKDKFRTIPGDFSRAAQLFGGCGQINGSCNGDGNGYIAGGDGSGNDTYSQDAEGTLAWNHLSIARMLPTFYTAAWSGPRAVYDTAWPKSSYIKSAIYNFYSIPRNAAVDGNSAFWWYGFTRKNSLVLGAINPDGSPPNYFQRGIIRPPDAMAIDAKLDDGKPKSGNIWAESTTSNDGTLRRCLTVHGQTLNTAYNTTYNESDHGCQILFVLETQ